MRKLPQLEVLNGKREVEGAQRLEIEGIEGGLDAALQLAGRFRHHCDEIGGESGHMAENKIIEPGGRLGAGLCAVLGGGRALQYGDEIAAAFLAGRLGLRFDPGEAALDQLVIGDARDVMLTKEAGLDGSRAAGGPAIDAGEVAQGGRHVHARGGS